MAEQHVQGLHAVVKAVQIAAFDSNSFGRDRKCVAFLRFWNSPCCNFKTAKCLLANVLRAFNHAAVHRFRIDLGKRCHVKLLRRGNCQLLRE